MSRFQSPNSPGRSERGNDSYQDRSDSSSGRPYQPRGHNNQGQGGGGNYGNRSYQGGGQGGQEGNRSYGQGGGGNYGNRSYQGGGQGGQEGNRSYGQGGGGNYGNRSYQGGGQGGQEGNRSYGQGGGGNYGNRSYQGGGQGGQGGNRSYGQGGGGNYGNRSYQGGGQGGQEGNRSYQRGGGGGNYGNRDRYDRQGGGNRYPQKNQEPMDPKLNIPMELPNSLFRVPTHPLTLAFQRAIGMAKGKVMEVNPKKNRGSIEIDGFQYKFEDNRRADMQRKYPIARFLDKEIMFSFWPTYSQKAAQYRKIDEAPTIKIANLRQMLPKHNAVEIIGELFLVEETLCVISLFSQTQKKKYFVTVCGKIEGNPGDIIQMEGHLEQGAIHYDSHNVLYSAAADVGTPA